MSSFHSRSAIFSARLAFCLGLALVGSTVGLSQGGAMQAVVGTWNGTYVCGQGETGLTVTITSDGSGQISAVINFFPIETTRIHIEPGSYSATGVLDSHGRFTLKPVAWINRPGNLAMLTYSGKLNDDFTVFEGAVPECGFGKKFRATKSSSAVMAASGAPASATAAPAAGAASAAKDEFSDPGQGAAADDVDPRSFTVGGIRLGMTKAEAIAALKKFNPTMVVYRELYAKDGIAPSPFPGDFNPLENHTPEELKGKDEYTLASVWASSRTITDEFYKLLHIDPKPKVIPGVVLDPPHAYWLDKKGGKNYLDMDAVPEDPLDLVAGGWATCETARRIGSHSDATDLTIVFSPSETDPRVVQVNYRQFFCDPEHEPTIESIRGSLLKRFHEPTFDPDNPAHIKLAKNPPRSGPGYAQIDERYLMWRFDARNRIMTADQAARMNLLIPRLTLLGGNVGIDTMLVADTGERQTGATSLQISMIDEDKMYTWKSDMGKIGVVQKSRAEERAKKELSKDPNRTRF